MWVYDEVMTAQSDSTKRKLAELSSEEFLKLVEEASPDELMELSQQAAPSKQTKARSDFSLLARVLAVPEGNRGLWCLVSWWELRRFLYNGLLLLALVPAGACFVLRFGLGMEVAYGFLSAFIYLCMANFCYTSGWISEAIARKCFGDKATYFGAILFAIGTGFSIFITLLISMAITLSSI